MSKFDGVLKTVWLLIGVLALLWMGVVKVPYEYRRWENRRESSRRKPSPKRELGVIIGAQAEQDRVEGIRRQGLRFGEVIDPLLAERSHADSVLPLSVDDWLLVPVNLATFGKPSLFNSIGSEYMVEVKESTYTWKQSVAIGDYARAPVHGVNIVFYRRDGSAVKLLLEQPAWISAVLVPNRKGDQFYYEMAFFDTNGDDRLDQKDDLSLWTSEKDGSNLVEVWMPAGQIEVTRYREPLSGDLFGTIVRDTDLDGAITEYDQPALFRMAIGDTVAMPVVPEAIVSKVHNIVFGEKKDHK